MKINITITKWNFLLIVGIVIILMAIGAYAYNAAFNNASSNPPVFGHSADEYDIAIRDSNGDILVITNLERFMSELPGIGTCNITLPDLASKGCPEGSYVFSYSDTKGQCKYFSSVNAKSADCYTQEDYGGCSYSKYLKTPECCGGTGDGFRRINCN